MNSFGNFYSSMLFINLFYDNSLKQETKRSRYRALGKKRKNHMF